MIGADPETYILMNSTAHQRKTTLAENNTTTVHQKPVSPLSISDVKPLVQSKSQLDSSDPHISGQRKPSFKHLLYCEESGEDALPESAK